MKVRQSRNWATPKPRGAVESIVSDKLGVFLEQNPAIGKLIVENLSWHREPEMQQEKPEI